MSLWQVEIASGRPEHYSRHHRGNDVNGRPSEEELSQVRLANLTRVVVHLLNVMRFYANLPNDRWLRFRAGGAGDGSKAVDLVNRRTHRRCPDTRHKGQAWSGETSQLKSRTILQSPADLIEK